MSVQTEALDRVIADSSLLRVAQTEDAYRAFEAVENELFAQYGAASQCVLITSATPREGRTSLAVSAAVHSALADAERRVLLIDADLQKPEAARALEATPDSPGLADYFGAGAPFDQVVQKTRLANLWVTGSGRMRSGRPHFGASRFQTFLEQARPKFDRIIIDAAAAREGNEILSLAKVAGAVVLVVRFRGPKREQIQKLLTDLDRVGARVVGGVLNQRVFPVPKFLYGA